MPNFTPWMLLRTSLATLMIIHGITRIYLGIVDDFGMFLSANGFPAGGLLAWAITLFEIAGSIALAAGYFVRYIAGGFAAQLVMGIFLVHLEHGWFVVGAGRNGIEYSVLLIISFVCLIWQDWESNQNN